MAYALAYTFKADEKLKVAVWAKGRVIPNYDAAVWRHDICGAVMKYESYGTEGDYGWEIDHIKPESKGGSSDSSNLQPLQWKNNRSKGDTYPWSP